MPAVAPRKRTTGTRKAQHSVSGASAPQQHILVRLFGESAGTKAAVIVLLTVVALLIVRPIVMSVFSYYRTVTVLTERRAEVTTLRSRHAQLKRQIEHYKTDVFLASQARSYGLSLPDETPFVIREYTHPESFNTAGKMRQQMYRYSSAAQDGASQ